MKVLAYRKGAPLLSRVSFSVVRIAPTACPCAIACSAGVCVSGVGEEQGAAAVVFALMVLVLSPML